MARFFQYLPDMELLAAHLGLYELDCILPLTRKEAENTTDGDNSVVSGHAENKSEKADEAMGALDGDDRPGSEEDETQIPADGVEHSGKIVENAAVDEEVQVQVKNVTAEAASLAYTCMDNERLRTKIKKLREEVASMEKTELERQNTNDETERNLSETRKRIIFLEERVADAEIKKFILASEVESMKSEAKDAKQMMMETFQCHNAAFQQSHDNESKALREAAKTDKDNMNEIIQTLIEKNASLTTKVQDLEDAGHIQRETIKCDVAAQQQQSDNDSAASKRLQKCYQHQVEQKDTEITYLEMDLERANSKIRDCDETLRGQINAARIEIGRWRRLTMDLSGDLESNRIQKEQALQEARKTEKANMVGQRIALTNLEKTVETLQSSHIRIFGKLKKEKKLRKRDVLASNLRASKGREKLQAIIQRLEKEKLQSESDNAELQVNNMSLQNDLRGKNEEVVTLRQGLQGTKMEIVSLRRELQDANEEILLLREDLQHAVSETDTYQQVQIAANKRVHAMEWALSRKEEHVKMLKGTIRCVRNERAGLQASVEKLWNEGRYMVKAYEMHIAWLREEVDARGIVDPQPPRPTIWNGHTAYWIKDVGTVATENPPSVHVDPLHMNDSSPQNTSTPLSTIPHVPPIARMTSTPGAVSQPAAEDAASSDPSDSCREYQQPSDVITPGPSSAETATTAAINSIKPDNSGSILPEPADDPEQSQPKVTVQLIPRSTVTTLDVLQSRHDLEQSNRLDHHAIVAGEESQNAAVVVGGTNASAEGKYTPGPGPACHKDVSISDSSKAPATPPEGELKGAPAVKESPHKYIAGPAPLIVSQNPSSSPLTTLVGPSTAQRTALQTPPSTPTTPKPQGAAVEPKTAPEIGQRTTKLTLKPPKPPVALQDGNIVPKEPTPLEEAEAPTLPNPADNQTDALPDSMAMEDVEIPMPASDSDGKEYTPMEDVEIPGPSEPKDQWRTAPQESVPMEDVETQESSASTKEVGGISQRSAPMDGVEAPAPTTGLNSIDFSRQEHTAMEGVDIQTPPVDTSERRIVQQEDAAMDWTGPPEPRHTFDPSLIIFQGHKSTQQKPIINITSLSIASDIVGVAISPAASQSLVADVVAGGTLQSSQTPSKASTPSMSNVRAPRAKSAINPLNMPTKSKAKRHEATDQVGRLSNYTRAYGTDEGTRRYNAAKARVAKIAEDDTKLNAGPGTPAEEGAIDNGESPPKIDVTKPTTTSQETNADISSMSDALDPATELRKRAREDDEADDDRGAAKRVDVKYAPPSSLLSEGPTDTG